MGFSTVFGAEDDDWLPPAEDDKLKNGKRPPFWASSNLRRQAKYSIIKIYQNISKNRRAEYG